MCQESLQQTPDLHTHSHNSVTQAPEFQPCAGEPPEIDTFAAARSHLVYSLCKGALIVFLQHCSYLITVTTSFNLSEWIHCYSAVTLRRYGMKYRGPGFIFLEDLWLFDTVEGWGGKIVDSYVAHYINNWPYKACLFSKETGTYGSDCGKRFCLATRSSFVCPDSRNMWRTQLATTTTLLWWPTKTVDLIGQAVDVLVPVGWNICPSHYCISQMLNLIGF